MRDLPRYDYSPLFSTWHSDADPVYRDEKQVTVRGKPLLRRQTPEQKPFVNAAHRALSEDIEMGSLEHGIRQAYAQTGISGFGESIVVGLLHTFDDFTHKHPYESLALGWSLAGVGGEGAASAVFKAASFARYQRDGVLAQFVAIEKDLFSKAYSHGSTHCTGVHVAHNILQSSATMAQEMVTGTEDRTIIPSLAAGVWATAIKSKGHELMRFGREYLRNL